MKFKRLIQNIAGFLVLPRVIFYRIACQVIGRRALMSSSQSMARVPGMRGVFLRQAFYRRVLARCGDDVQFGWQSTFSMPEARVGDRVYVGSFCTIGFADIGPEVMVSDHVTILSGGHEHGQASSTAETMREQDQSYTRVTIGRGAWIGAGATIMADVGEGSTIGAGAVVNRPIPSWSLAVGVPAKVIKQIRPDASVDR